MKRRPVLTLALAAAIALGTLSPVDAAPGLKQIGFHKLLGTGFNTNVWAHPTKDGRLFAYVGTWGTTPDVADDACTAEGVKVVDITNPAGPKFLGTLTSPTGSHADDVEVARIRSPKFTGDLLAHTVAACGVDELLRQTAGDAAPPLPRATTGVRLFDVTEPRRIAPIGIYESGGLGATDLTIFTRKDLKKTYVAAVFRDVEGFGGGVPIDGLVGIHGELRILDVTDPGAIAVAGTYVPEDDFFFCYPRGADGDCYLDGVSVSSDGKTAYLAWRDGGVVAVDIKKPSAPKLVGGALSQVDGDEMGWLDEEGNTHTALPVEVNGKRFVVASDEDYDAGTRYARVVPSSKVSGRDAVEWDGPPKLGAKGLSGELFYGGGGCFPSAFDGAPPRFIALVEEFDCFENLITIYEHKLRVAALAGASAIVLISESSTPGAVSAGGDIPAVSVGWLDGVALRRRVDPGTKTGLRVRLSATGPVNPWGYMRVLNMNSKDVAKWRQVATYKTPRVTRPNPSANALYSAHNAFAKGNRVYFAWWTDGVRVLRIGRNGAPAEIGSFLPKTGIGDPHNAWPASAGIWGVHAVTHPRTGREIVLASDVNRGLYILSAP